MKPKTGSRFSITAFICPILIILFAFTCRIFEDEEIQMRVFAAGVVCVVLLALLGLVGAFVRNEKLRWFTVIPLLVLLSMFGVGQS